MARLPVPAGPWKRYAWEGSPRGGSAGPSTARACGCESMPGRIPAGSLAGRLPAIFGHPRGARYGAGVARGTLVSIEGLDGAGKSTLAEALAAELRASAKRVALLR